MPWNILSAISPLNAVFAKNSVLAYRSDLSDFIAYLKACSISSYMAVTRDDIIDYLSDCKDRGMEVATLARRLVAIKVFFRYLFQERIIGADITDVMDSPKLWRILPEFMSTAEVDAFLNAFSANSKDPLTLRNRCILEMMYACGTARFRNSRSETGIAELR